MASARFAHAERASKFLQFAVEQTLAGAGSRLKGYSIGVDVFGRPADFNPRTDPLVRVEAGRLRTRLAQYYSGEGATDPIRLQLPRGSYVVTGEYQGPRNTEPAAAAPVAECPRTPVPWRLATATLGVLLAVAVGVIVSQRQALVDAGEALEVQDQPHRTEWPQLVVVPFENLSPERPRLDGLAASVTEEVMLALDHLDLFVVAGQARSSGETEIATGAPGSYLLTGSVRGGVGQARITTRLFDAQSGQQLWTSSYDEPSLWRSLPELVGRDVAALGAPYGPIFEAEKAAQSTLHTLELRDCLVKYYEYRRRINADTFADALLCFRTVGERKPRAAEVWAGQAMLHLDSYAYRFGPSGAESLDAARDATAKALSLDGDDFLGNLAQARVYFYDGDPRLRAALERTLALRPASGEALALTGSLLTASGDSAAGLPLIERARAASQISTSSYYVAYAVTYLRAGEYEQALDAALKIDAPDWIVAHALVAATAGLAGRDVLAEQAARRLLELYPAFEAEALQDFEKWRFEPAYRDQFLKGLKAAGLDVAGAPEEGFLTRDEPRGEDHGRFRPSPGGLAVEHGFKGPKPLIDAPRADSAAVVERIAAPPVRRRPIPSSATVMPIEPSRR